MYILLGCSENKKWERIDSAPTKKEAEYLKREYSIAFGSEWEFKIIEVEESEGWE